MKEKLGITDSELEVMQILWDCGEPVTTNEVVRRLQAEKGWERSTIRTLLKRLVEKGAVIQEKQDVYIYTPAISKEAFAKEQTKGLIDRLYRGSAKNLVASLVGNRDLSDEDIQELRDFLMDEK